MRFRGVDNSPSVVEYANRRGHQHLSRFGRQVSRLLVRISDLNGPKGGADKRCQLMAVGPRLGAVNLSETHGDVFAGIDLALDKLAHVIGRRLDRASAAQASRQPRSTV